MRLRCTAGSRRARCCSARGGRGLCSQEQLAPAAWVGSWAQCLAEVRARTGIASLADLDTCELPLAAACRNALASLPRRATDANDKVSWQDLAQQPRQKLQKHFSNRLTNKTCAGLLEALDLERGGHACVLAADRSLELGNSPRPALLASASTKGTTRSWRGRLSAKLWSRLAAQPAASSGPLATALASTVFQRSAPASPTGSRGAAAPSSGAKLWRAS